MRVSVIIPSYNQGQFLTETLASVLSQEGPLAEIIVIDGGSTDGTVEILRTYEDQLAYWVSEPDRGQAHAINKGLLQASGDIWLYLNSDDVLAAGALSKVAAVFERPDVKWVSGAAIVLDDSGRIKNEIRPKEASTLKDYICPWSRSVDHTFPFSGASFMRREVYDTIGGFDEALHFSMDMEYYARALFVGSFNQVIIDDILAHWKIHSGTKTANSGGAFGFRKDEIEIARRYAFYLSPVDRDELMREIDAQTRLLPSREIMWFVRSGHRWQALARAFSALLMDPSLFVSRPWLGAVRRALIGR